MSTTRRQPGNLPPVDRTERLAMACPSEPELDELRLWVGRSESTDETLSPVPSQCLAATLSLPATAWPGEHLPPLWHMLHFPDTTPTIELSDDGTPRDMALLPPVDAPQMLWAGADCTFHAPLALGVATRRRSRVSDVTARQGSRGRLVFVTLEHCYLQGGEAHLVENVHLVFAGAASPTAPGARHASPGPAASERRWPVNETLLFRFSALTFNALRIHYDKPYTTGVAGYPGLVVHGPLQAILLAETLRAAEPQCIPRRARFRALAPLFCADGNVSVCTAPPAGNDPSAERVLWTCSGTGGVAMEARFEFR